MLFNSMLANLMSDHDLWLAMVGEGKSSSVSAPSSEMVSNFETLEGFLREMRAAATSIHCCRYLASFATALEEDSPSFFLSFYKTSLIWS